MYVFLQRRRVHSAPSRWVQIALEREAMLVIVYKKVQKK